MYDSQAKNLLVTLREEKEAGRKGGIYHKTQVELTYNSNHIEGSRLTHDIIDFYVRFERIHPFQDGNGRVGRLLMFKECLAQAMVPFIVTDELKMFYYRGLAEWGHVDGYLTDILLTVQDQYKAWLDYFRIKY